MKLRAVQDDFIDVFDTLPDGPIKTAVDNAKKDLKQDKIIGEHVKRKQIPKYYLTRHRIPILYRHALPNRWGMTYSIMEFEVKGELCILLLELMNHINTTNDLVIIRKSLPSISIC